MKNIRQTVFPILAMLASVVLVAGCSISTPAITAIPDGDSVGADVYRARCSSCHALPHPRRLSYAGWQALLPVMEQRMQERDMEKLSDEERRTLLTYLKEHSR
ncbi:MAG TPA: hypothetical protein ENI83_00870 [Gammaproteobacteria bacterium]|nr:hypothetical protein [Gammaproteobacteria bacterium]